MNRKPDVLLVTETTFRAYPEISCAQVILWIDRSLGDALFLDVIDGKVIQGSTFTPDLSRYVAPVLAWLAGADLGRPFTLIDYSPNANVGNPSDLAC